MAPSGFGSEGVSGWVPFARYQTADLQDGQTFGNSPLVRLGLGSQA